MTNSNTGNAALMFRIPETVSWTLNYDEQECAGDTLRGFAKALSAVPRGMGTTVSITCLVELNAMKTA